MNTLSITKKAFREMMNQFVIHIPEDPRLLHGGLERVRRLQDDSCRHCPITHMYLSSIAGVYHQHGLFSQCKYAELSANGMAFKTL